MVCYPLFYCNQRNLFIIKVAKKKTLNRSAFTEAYNTDLLKQLWDKQKNQSWWEASIPTRITLCAPASHLFHLFGNVNLNQGIFYLVLLAWVWSQDYLSSLALIIPPFNPKSFDLTLSSPPVCKQLRIEAESDVTAGDKFSRLCPQLSLPKPASSQQLSSSYFPPLRLVLTSQCSAQPCNTWTSLYYPLLYKTGPY